MLPFGHVHKVCFDLSRKITLGIFGLLEGIFSGFLQLFQFLSAHGNQFVVFLRTQLLLFRLSCCVSFFTCHVVLPILP